MPRFVDTMTGRTIDAEGTRADYFRQSPGRFQEQTEGRVPDGSIAEVLAWVGDDAERKAQALAAEQSGKQRSSLIKKLS